MNTTKIIQQLQLKPHPEGGYFKETYRSVNAVTTHNNTIRCESTAIYYLLENEDKSYFHKIESDELWFFHQGNPLEIISIQNNNIVTTILGNDIENGEQPQAIIPARTWFCAHIKGSMGYALVSCTVAPGFDFVDFQLASREKLLLEFPHLQEVILKFTK